MYTHIFCISSQRFQELRARREKESGKYAQQRKSAVRNKALKAGQSMTSSCTSLASKPHITVQHRSHADTESNQHCRTEWGWLEKLDVIVNSCPLPTPAVVSTLSCPTVSREFSLLDRAVLEEEGVILPQQGRRRRKLQARVDGERVGDSVRLALTSHLCFHEHILILCL